jgi:hypothetical protein
VLSSRKHQTPRRQSLLERQLRFARELCEQVVRWNRLPHHRQARDVSSHVSIDPRIEGRELHQVAFPFFARNGHMPKLATYVSADDARDLAVRVLVSPGRVDGGAAESFRIQQRRNCEPCRVFAGHPVHRDVAKRVAQDTTMSISRNPTSCTRSSGRSGDRLVTTTGPTPLPQRQGPEVRRTYASATCLRALRRAAASLTRPDASKERSIVAKAA